MGTDPCDLLDGRHKGLKKRSVSLLYFVAASLLLPEASEAGMGSLSWDDCDDCGSGTSTIGGAIFWTLLVLWGLITNPRLTITISIVTSLVIVGLIYTFKALGGSTGAIILGVLIGLPLGIYISARVYRYLFREE